MKKLLYLLLFAILLLSACGKEQSSINIEGENSTSQEDSSNSQENTYPENESNSGIIIEDIEQTPEQGNNSSEDSNDNSEENNESPEMDEPKDKAALEIIVRELLATDNPLAITLGEYNEHAGLYAVSHTWLLHKDGFIPETNPNGSLYAPEWTVTAAGIIEFVEDELCYFIGPGCPQINNNACQGQYNFEKIENGWLCEVKLLLYNNIMIEEALSYFWCIIDIDDENSSKWIYLNQEAFSKEDALLIATYLIDR